MPFFRLPEVFYTKPTQPTASLQYGRKPMQKANLRVPDGEGPFPLVFVLHGGQWKSTYSHKQTEYLCEDLKCAGVATCNLEFRRLGHVGGGFPGTFDDIRAGIDHALQQSVNWPIDTARVSVLGHSSGGHLAFCLPRVHPSFSPHALIGLAGVYDVGGVRDKLKLLVDQFFGSHLPISPIDLPELSAIKQLIVVGAQDGRLLQQAERYVAATESSNRSFLVIPETSHFTIIDPTAINWSQIRGAIIATVS